MAEAAAQGDVCQVANDNEPTQVVLSGHKSAIDRIAEVGKALGVRRAVPLPVSAPFHCALMQPAADAMAEAFEKTPPGPLRVALFANVTASVVTAPTRLSGKGAAHTNSDNRARLPMQASDVLPCISSGT